MPVTPPPVTAAPTAQQPSSILSRIALGAAGLLAFVLLCFWAGGSTQAIYSAVMLAIQLAVVIAVIAALADRRGRKLGSIALALVLLVNVGTIGAASAIGRHPGVVDATTTTDPEDDYWAAYPGMRNRSESDILSRPSLEETVDTGNELLAAIRARLTSEFGVEWVRGIEGMTRNERNGYGGESMLVQYTSENWATTEAIRDYDLKYEMLDAIDDVLGEYGMWPAIPFNDPASGFDPAYIERLYGSADPRTQPLWESYSEDFDETLRFYVDISDLTHDDDGRFRRAREALVAGSSEPIEGLRISFLATEVLSEADVEEFQERMQAY